jgi:hypothetical protein
LQSSVNITGLKETISELKKLDPDLLKQMRSEIKREPGLVNAMNAIKSEAPAISPLRGMMHSGRTGYSKPKVATSFRPGGRMGMSKEKSIITINTTAPKNAIGFEIIDMVGRGSKANSAKARGMQRGLGGKPSRYVWKAVEGKQQLLTQAVISIIKRYSDKANIRLRVR